MIDIKNRYTEVTKKQIGDKIDLYKNQIIKPYRKEDLELDIQNNRLINTSLNIDVEALEVDITKFNRFERIEWVKTNYEQLIKPKEELEKEN